MLSSSQAVEPRNRNTQWRGSSFSRRRNFPPHSESDSWQSAAARPREPQRELSGAMLVREFHQERVRAGTEGHGHHIGIEHQGPGAQVFVTALTVEPHADVPGAPQPQFCFLFSLGLDGRPGVSDRPVRSG